ncbi:MAG TPA: FAD-binding oxidoreductase, partial [Planctomycetaceae bacterium]
MRADAIEATATVVEQVRMARDTYRLRLRCPELARRITPGQFFMVRTADGSDPLLGRPFALYDTFEENGAPAGVDFGYLVVGKMTTEMTRWRPGDAARVWGPLGNG